MILKFNNSVGALLCESCRVIVMEDMMGYEWHALINLNDKNMKWFCERCSPESQMKQNEAFVNEVNSMADEYSMKKRIKLRNKYGFLPE